MNNNVQISILNDEAEKAEILRNFKTTFLKEDSVRLTKEYFNKISKLAYFLVAYLDNSLCGFCAFYANNLVNKTAYITLVAVLPSMHNKGIGTLLLKNTCNFSKDYGMSKIQLEVLKRNTTALSFYKSNGFTIYKNVEESVFMEKILD